MTKQCQCVDDGCPVAHGPWSRDRQFPCRERAIAVLYRVDMDDRTGTQFCDRCDQDASESGLFTDEAPR